MFPLPTASSPQSLTTGQLQPVKQGNESARHFELKLAAWRWLRRSGFELRGAEVMLPLGRVDLVGIKGAELRVDEDFDFAGLELLVPPPADDAPPWQRDRHRLRSHAFAQMLCAQPLELTMVLIEAKASRHDFRCDLREKRAKLELAPQIASRCYYIGDPEAISADEVPAGWGLIRPGEDAEALPRVVKHAPRKRRTSQQAAWMAINALTRPVNLAAEIELEIDPGPTHEPARHTAG